AAPLGPVASTVTPLGNASVGAVVSQLTTFPVTVTLPSRWMILPAVFRPSALNDRLPLTVPRADATKVTWAIAACGDGMPLPIVVQVDGRVIDAGDPIAGLR